MDWLKSESFELWDARVVRFSYFDVSTCLLWAADSRRCRPLEARSREPEGNEACFEARELVLLLEQGKVDRPAS